MWMYDGKTKQRASSLYTNLCPPMVVYSQDDHCHLYLCVCVTHMKKKKKEEKLLLAIAKATD